MGARQRANGHAGGLYVPGEGRPARVRNVRVRVRVAGVRIEEHSADEVVRARVPGGREEPQFVPPDRAAESGVDIPDGLDRFGRRQTAILQVLREVVALHRVKSFTDLRAPGSMPGLMPINP